ncbi:hypothetical protein Fot_04707 [Forsythia ovata]|uniref:Uncharacterized protein n=1 Tax=Forsythia ovata TaxID=205694 RepID=A0ABD1XGD6_9LAMI
MQPGHRQGGHQRSFSGTRSSYAAGITEAIPNLYDGLNAPHQGVPTREAVSSKNNSSYQSNEMRHRLFQDAMNERQGRKIGERDRGQSQERENAPRMEMLGRVHLQ